MLPINLSVSPKEIKNYIKRLDPIEEINWNISPSKGVSYSDHYCTFRTMLHEMEGRLKYNCIITGSFLANALRNLPQFQSLPPSTEDGDSYLDGVLEDFAVFRSSDVDTNAAYFVNLDSSKDLKVESVLIRCI